MNIHLTGYARRYSLSDPLKLCRLLLTLLPKENPDAALVKIEEIVDTQHTERVGEVGFHIRLKINQP